MTDARIGPGRIRSGLADLPDHTDVLVIGLGVTGAGVALDAASRGLSVVAVDAHDLAFGTSRWSSKLVHGGLRYLANGQIGVAYESAVERQVLIEVTAPHLVHPMATLTPLQPGMSRTGATLARAGFTAGNLLRVAARTKRRTLPPPRRISAARTLELAPALARDGLRGGLLSWDGKVEDDARLVVAIARTAAAHGALVRNHVRVVEASGTSARLRDERTGESRTVTARAVINATGVWAGEVVDEVRLRPSQGTHLVVRADAIPGTTVNVTVPVPGSHNRFVLLLPQPDGTVYVGLTDDPLEGPIPDVPTPRESEIDFLLEVASSALERPLTRADVVGTYAGLRPLLDSGEESTADISRRHAVLRSSTGVITIVGGKLTTYRRMAEDAVDATGLADGRCVTRELPLLGAAHPEELARVDAPARLVRRFGTEAPYVLAHARAVTGLGDDELLAPIAEQLPATLAELVFGVTHEGAVDVEDLLDRRVRIGLVPADRELAVPVAERALELGLDPTDEF
jgi:glycerol-3-phosphate dehydrogenase